VCVCGLKGKLYTYTLWHDVLTVRSKGQGHAVIKRATTDVGTQVDITAQVSS